MCTAAQDLSRRGASGRRRLGVWRICRHCVPADAHCRNAHRVYRPWVGTRASIRTYWYAWKGGPPLRGEPGSPEFVASFNEAVARKVAPPTGVLQALLFRFQESAEFQFGISPRTRRDYVKQIKRIERDFGDFPIKG